MQAGKSDDTVLTPAPKEDHAKVDQEDPAEESAVVITTMVDALADIVFAEDTLHNTTAPQHLTGLSRRPMPLDQAATHPEIPTNIEGAPQPAAEVD